MNADERAAKNRELAEALGYKVEQRDEPSFQGADRVIQSGLVTPEGTWKPVLRPFRAATADECWQKVPDFYGSVDATLAELRSKPVYLKLYLHGTPSALLVAERDNPMYPGDILEDGYYGEGATIEEALANALLAYAQAQRADAGKGDVP